MSDERETVNLAASPEEYLAQVRRGLVPDPETGNVEPDVTIGLAMGCQLLIRRILREQPELMAIEGAVPTAHINVVGIMLAASLADYVKPGAEDEIIKLIVPLIEKITGYCREGRVNVEKLHELRDAKPASSSVN